MGACYHPGVIFFDPVFGQLQGEAVTAMWHMLCARARDLEITFTNVQADDATGRARWEARYCFSKTGRPVHNLIQAAFLFREGRIIRHTDTFNFWHWARMALGPVGVLLGWTPILQHAIRKEALRNLQEFMQKHQASKN